MQQQLRLARGGGSARAASSLRRTIPVRCAATVQSVRSLFGDRSIGRPMKEKTLDDEARPPLTRQGLVPPQIQPQPKTKSQPSTPSTTTPSLSNLDRVSILAEALPYMQRFAGKTVVVKYGGAAMKDPSLKARVITDLVLLWTVGIRPVLVHGGGPEINTWLGKLGIEAEFKNGLRVTDGELR
jgi:hypothetical protein